MRHFILMLLGLAFASPATGQGTGTPRIVPPSFSCAGKITPTEAIICTDSELRAYDRAMALAYRTKIRAAGRSKTQQEWLVRRDRCGSERACVRRAYLDRLKEDQFYNFPTTLRRIAAAPADLSQRMLETLQSPRDQRLKSLSSPGTLFIRSLGENWYFFQANAQFLYDPGDGRGTNVSTASAAGIVRLNGDTGTFAEEPGDSEACTIRFRKYANGRWRLDELGRCSGLGATLGGLYGR